MGLPSWAKLALSLPIKGPSYELPDRNGAGQSPEEHRIFLAKDLTPLSSVAFGDTSFLRKEAIELRYAAVLT